MATPSSHVIGALESLRAHHEGRPGEYRAAARGRSAGSPTRGGGADLLHDIELENVRIEWVNGMSQVVTKDEGGRRHRPAIANST